MLGAGADLIEVLRHLEITESTWHRWRRAYAGMSASDARRLKELEAVPQMLPEALLRRELDQRCCTTAGSASGSRMLEGGQGQPQRAVKYPKRRNACHPVPSRATTRATPALVAQWIEHRSPKPCAQVRFLPGAPPVPLSDSTCAHLTGQVTSAGHMSSPYAQIMQRTRRVVPCRSAPRWATTGASTTTRSTPRNPSNATETMPWPARRLCARG